LWGSVVNPEKKRFAGFAYFPCPTGAFASTIKSAGRPVKLSFFMKIDHLGIATKGIDEALKFWSDALGLENIHTEVVEDQKVRVAMLPIGESRIELLEPTSEDSPISKFLEKRGGGIHHIAVEVENIESALNELKSKGVRLIDEAPRVGAEGCLVAFVHPSSTGGVLLELVQTSK
jgi:methylmalonyl-CoA/ethylmalonyl-CoA epimerase